MNSELNCQDSYSHFWGLQVQSPARKKVKLQRAQNQTEPRSRMDGSSRHIPKEGVCQDFDMEIRWQEVVTKRRV